MSEDPTSLDKKPDSKTILYLPPASDYDGINRNFATIMGFLTEFSKQVKEHADNTDQNIEQLVSEISENFQKVGEDFKSVLSSQTNVIVLAVIGISTALKIINGLWEVISKYL